MAGSEQNSTFKRLFIPLTTKKAIIIIAIVGILVYCNALFGAFVWDDVQQIKDNTTIRSLSNFPKFFSGVPIANGGYNLHTWIYRPLMFVSFSAIYSLFGAQPFFFHLFQLFIHILNSIILYLVLCIILGMIDKKIKEKEWNSLSGSQKIKLQRKYGWSAPQVIRGLEQHINVLSLFLALLFLIHPIDEVAAAYISALNDTLYFLFGITALLLSVREEVSLKRSITIGLLLLCSLLSKETGVLFLFVILLFHLLFNRKKLLTLFAVELLAFAIYCFMRIAVGGFIFGKLIYFPAPIPIANLTLLGRMINIPAIVLYYLTTAFFPLRLAVQQNWIVTKVTAHDFYLPLLLDSVFFIGLWIGGTYLYTHKRIYFKAFLFFALWFITGLLLHVQFIPLDMTVADTWFYFPLVGLLGMLGVVVQALLFSPTDKHNIPIVKLGKAKKAIPLLGVLFLLLLSLRTIVRNTSFRDEKTLYTHDMDVEPSFNTEMNLGIQEERAGNIQAALPLLQKSVSLYPWAMNIYNLGYFYEGTGNLQQAKEYYYKAVAELESPTSPAYLHDIHADQKVYMRLAWVLLNSGEYEAAVQISKKGVQRYPDFSILWEELAISESKLHNQKAAIDAAIKAKTLSPNDLNSYLYMMIANKQDIPPVIISAFVKQ